MGTIKPREITFKARSVYLLRDIIESAIENKSVGDIEYLLSQEGLTFYFWATDKGIIGIVEEFKSKKYEMEIEIK